MDVSDQTTIADIKMQNTDFQKMNNGGFFLVP
jgi:hypothetical protein